MGAAPAPVAAAAEAQDAAASEASFRLAAMHSRLAYVRGGPSPQRTLRWDPRFAYPPVAAQNLPEAFMNMLLQQAQAAGGSPAGLHQRGQTEGAAEALAADVAADVAVLRRMPSRRLRPSRRSWPSWRRQSPPTPRALPPFRFASIGPTCRLTLSQSWAIV